MIGSKKIDEVVGSLAWYYLVMEGKCAKEIVSEYTSKCICTGGYFGMTAVVCSKAECALLRWFIYAYNMVNTLLNYQEVLKYMSDVIITRRGGRGGGGGKPKFHSEVIISNTIWTVPYDIVNNELHVRIFGGGGGGGFSYYNEYTKGGAGGGGGWMNNDKLNIPGGTQIAITIGDGGIKDIKDVGQTAVGSSGGSTSFGRYLSANGGSGGSISNIIPRAGNGGSGGGSYYNSAYTGVSGGTGYQFGGGGIYHIRGYSVSGGDGGVWGGGGGGFDYNSYGGNGGTYGGGGGGPRGNGVGGTYGGNQGQNGTNTIGWTNTELNILTNSYVTGHGECQKVGNRWYGGGGFGGDGGYYGGSGGGGYGGDGGSGPAGGGGGFGSSGTGGSGYGGGGGGYYGAGAGGSVNAGGGGGYTTGHGKGGDGGGDIYTTSNGNSGICIIQYYTKE